EFGTSADYTTPPGGIFLWLKLPDSINTCQLAKAAAAQGVEINPGAEWSLQNDSTQHIRICFANPPLQTIDEGVKALANICHREFGLPEFSANTAR
ncbi:MAG: PLP-dependent aminotransferase family protein, partial [Pseudomonadota bacterium]